MTWILWYYCESFRPSFSKNHYIRICLSFRILGTVHHFSDIPSLPHHHSLPIIWMTTCPYCARNNVKELNNVNSLSNQFHINMKQPGFWQEKYYIWEDIHSESIMKEFHLIKLSRKDPILKEGKVKVARETIINTKKWNPILTSHSTLSITGLGLGFPWWPCS